MDRGSARSEVNPAQVPTETAPYNTFAASRIPMPSCTAPSWARAAHPPPYSSLQAVCHGTVALSPRANALRLLGGSFDCPAADPAGAMAATAAAAGSASASASGAPQPLHGVYAVLGPQSGAAANELKFRMQPPRSPKVKQMECLLMSPTRRTAKKPQSWQWDYGTAAAAAIGPAAAACTKTPLPQLQLQSQYQHPSQTGVTQGLFREKQPKMDGSPIGADAAATAAAVSVLHLGTPVAVAAGQLSDSCDT